MPVEVLLLFLEDALLLLQGCLELLDLSLFLLNLSLLVVDLLLLVLALDGVLRKDGCLFGHVVDHLLLLETVLLSLGIQLLSSGYNLLLLPGEVLVSVTLLPLFLEQSYGLERSLTLNHVGSDFVEILITDLRVGILPDGPVYSFEQLLDLGLLVHVHF